VNTGNSFCGWWDAPPAWERPWRWWCRRVEVECVVLATEGARGGRMERECEEGSRAWETMCVCCALVDEAYWGEACSITGMRVLELLFLLVEAQTL